MRDVAILSYYSNTAACDENKLKKGFINFTQDIKYILGPAYGSSEPIQEKGARGNRTRTFHMRTDRCSSLLGGLANTHYTQWIHG